MNPPIIEEPLKPAFIGLPLFALVKVSKGEVCPPLMTDERIAEFG
jgi:hypothetical protein